jgi:hypothetical protein
MLMRLGLNVQDAINNTKEDILIECRDISRDIELKNDKNI